MTMPISPKKFGCTVKTNYQEIALISWQDGYNT